jgi:hypothetical protein
MALCASAHVGLGPTSLPLQQQPKCFPRLLVPPLIDRTSTASGYSTAHGPQALRAALGPGPGWISHATAKHSTLASPVAFFYFQHAQGAWRFHPRSGARLPPLPQPASVHKPTDAELFLPQLLLPATRRAPSQWALHITSTRSFLLPLSQPTAAELLQTQLVLPAIRRARWALQVASTRARPVLPMRLCAPTTPPSGAVKLGRPW